MPTADEYRARAAEFREKARLETRPKLRAHNESMAHGYLRLAELADHMSKSAGVYETPKTKPNSSGGTAAATSSALD